MGVGTNEAFERALRDEIPRGLKGREETLPRSLWSEPAELGPAWEFGNAGHGLLLGYRKDREVAWSCDRHALSVAGTRSGKGVSLIIPNLLNYTGSVLAIDPKGELARITGRRRAQIGKLVVLDPFDENGRFPSGHYNPLDELDPNGKEVIDEAGAIADAMVVYSGQGDPHWTAAARGVLQSLILLALDLDRGERNLISVRRMLMYTHPVLRATAQAQGLSHGKTFIEMLIAMGDRFERVVCGQGEALKDMAEKEKEAVLSETRTQTRFLDSPSLARILTKSDFSLKDLTKQKLSVFLCLPARHMDTLNRWPRIMMNQAVGALEPRRSLKKSGAQGDVPVLLLLEEFPMLGHMEKLEAAAGQLAGSGVKLWVIVQNLGQLKRHYKDGWETFIANAGVITAFGNSDLETLDYLSRKLGKIGMRVQRGSNASSSQLLGGARLEQEELREGRLLEVDELCQLVAREKQRVLVMAAGQKPLILERATYFKDARFQGMFDD